MRISWRTRICKNIPRPWRPWPTGEMVYCECGTTNKKQGEYLEAGGEGVVGGGAASRYSPSFALGVPHSCICIGSMIAVWVYGIYTSDERLKVIHANLWYIFQICGIFSKSVVYKSIYHGFREEGVYKSIYPLLSTWIFKFIHIHIFSKNSKSEV